MNGFKFSSAIKKLGKKYRKCPSCGRETEVEMHDEKIYIECQCGVNIVADEDAKILSHTRKEDGITYCALCGEKVENAQCSCSTKIKSKKK